MGTERETHEFHLLALVGVVETKTDAACSTRDIDDSYCFLRLGEERRESLDDDGGTGGVGSKGSS